MHDVFVVLNNAYVQESDIANVTVDAVDFDSATDGEIVGGDENKKDDDGIEEISKGDTESEGDTAKDGCGRFVADEEFEEVPASDEDDEEVYNMLKDDDMIGVFSVGTFAAAEEDIVDEEVEESQGD